jgi:uncharacterized heparinase superfamily protein
MQKTNRILLKNTRLIERILSKSFGTIVFRGKQEAFLKFGQITGGWQRIERKISRWATRKRADEWNKSASFAVLASDGKEALCKAAEKGFINSDSLIEIGDVILKRDFNLFGVPLPESGPWPWHEDWRFGKVWAPDYFRNYVHDAPRSQPYDVKFPWELSRMAFLHKMIQADILTGECHRKKEMINILKNWKDCNPLAHSINWYPMEAAMRAVSLCLASDMVRQAGIGVNDACLFMELLAQHGEFVMRTIEKTDNAGNHFTAELVALLLIGRTLQKFYSPALRWCRFAKKRLVREIHTQFLSDGVNFEKSTAYHRLVQDLFILGRMALERSGENLTCEQNNRLHAAARYNAAFMRPDNECPLIGDSDDAVVFECDDYSVRDHRSSLGIAALAFGNGELRTAAGKLPAAGLWLFGVKALDDWQNMAMVAKPFQGHHHFNSGGMVIAKSDQHYLIMDIGEVGQNGLGGHGHNDILSFELFLNGKPFIVDPGSYLYSGDFDAHDRFRSSRSHNGVVIDGQEIAPFKGKFRIADQARPTTVDVSTRDKYVTIINAGHTGYKILPDPIIHYRTLYFDRCKGSLFCKDKIEASDDHQAVRRLHFSPGISPEIHNNEAHIKAGDEVIIINWDAHSHAQILKDEVSPGFGRLETANTLEIATNVSKEDTLILNIYLKSHGPLYTGDE